MKGEGLRMTASGVLASSRSYTSSGRSDPGACGLFLRHRPETLKGGRPCSPIPPRLVANLSVPGQSWVSGHRRGLFPPFSGPVGISVLVKLPGGPESGGASVSAAGRLPRRKLRESLASFGSPAREGWTWYLTTGISLSWAIPPASPSDALDGFLGNSLGGPFIPTGITPRTCRQTCRPPIAPGDRESM
jgi:hypothetical protein